MKIFLFFFLISNMIFSQKVMIIGSYHDEYPWQREYKEALVKNLNGEYEIFSFNLDSKRLEIDKIKEKVKEAIEYIDLIKPDIVLLGDDNALNFLTKEVLQREIDIVFLGINENLRDYFAKKPDKITGVLSRPYYKRAINAIDKILNPARNILILFDSSPTSMNIIDENFIHVKKIFNTQIHIEVVYDFKSWKRIVEASRKGYDAIIIGSYQKIEDEGKYIDGEELMRWTSKNSPLPIFSFWAFGVGCDMSIGGLVVSGETQGVEASKIIKLILNEGKEPKEVYPISVLGGKYLFSRRQLKKWNLSLPKDIENISEYTD